MTLHDYIWSLDICSSLLICWLPYVYNDILFITITSVFELSEKTCVSPCFSLKVGRRDMTCFLFHKKYVTEVMICLLCIYDTETFLLYLLLVDIVACDLYFDSHILLFLIIILILIIHINCINCVYVREYYQYSLTHNKSLF